MSEIFLIFGVLQIQITGTVGSLTHEISHTHTHTYTHARARNIYIYIYLLTYLLTYLLHGAESFLRS